MARITIELSDDLKAAFACTEAEQQLAETLADLAFSEAKPGVRPLVYIELAARILAETADMAIATQSRRAADRSPSGRECYAVLRVRARNGIDRCAQ